MSASLREGWLAGRMELYYSDRVSISYRCLPVVSGGVRVNRTVMIRWMLVVLIGSVGLSGCGLDGVTGTLIRVDGEWYSIRTPKEKSYRYMSTPIRGKMPSKRAMQCTSISPKRATQNLFKSSTSKLAGGEGSADEVWNEASQRFYRKGLDLIIDNRSSDLSESTEHTLDNHLITFVDFQLPKAHNFESAGLVLE